METQKTRFSCHSCNREVELPLGEPPCEALKGWLTVSLWKGSGSVEHCNFCSFGCLKSWVDARAPEIPEIFLEPFKEDES